MTRLLSAFVLSSLCACSFGPKLIRPDVENVKKVAIIGFRGDVSIQDQSQQSGGIAATVASAKALSDMKSGRLNDRRTAQAKQIHDLLAQKLTSELGWELAPVEASSTLKERVRQKPTGVVIFGVQHVKELLLDGEARFMPAADRQKVISELGVDAIVTVSVNYRAGDRQGFAIGGLGTFKLFPRATITVQMWNATQDKPVWEDSFAMGATSKLSITENAGILEEVGETEALVDAATLGIIELIGRYKAAPVKS